MTKRFNTLKELKESFPWGEPGRSSPLIGDEFPVSQEELDWYIGEYYSGISPEQRKQRIESERNNQWYFKGVKLIVDPNLNL